MTAPPPAPMSDKMAATLVAVQHRMSIESYKQLEKKLSINHGCPKTKLEAGFQLGIRHVLDHIRKELVSGW